MSSQIIFKRMLQEEWRMHAELFGNLRYAMFPVFIFLMSTMFFVLLGVANVELSTVFLGLHVLVGLFGLQTGSIAFIGTDAMRNLLGDRTYLVYSARTLPISKQRLLGIFLLKDLLYYSVLFLLPITLGAAPLLFFFGGAIAVTDLLLLWVTLLATFMLGITLTITLISMLMSPISRIKSLIAIAVLGGVVSAVDIQLLYFTPYYIFLEPSINSVLSGLLPVVLLSIGIVLTFDPSSSRAARTRTNRYNTLRSLFPVSRSLVSKFLLDVSRSSGGVGKVFFSAGIIFLVTWWTIDFSSTLLGLSPVPALAYGTLLSLMTFTTYNWLTVTDSPDEYLFYPVTVSGVLLGKIISFLVLTVPVGVLFYGIVIVLYAPSLLEAVTGLFIYTSLSIYLLGITVYLSGFSPESFLFDAVKFITFTTAVIIVFVPILIVSFFIPDPSVQTLQYLLLFATSSLSIGVVLCYIALERWTVKVVGER